MKRVVTCNAERASARGGSTAVESGSERQVIGRRATVARPHSFRALRFPSRIAAALKESARAVASPIKEKTQRGPGAWIGPRARAENAKTSRFAVGSDRREGGKAITGAAREKQARAPPLFAAELSERAVPV